MMNDERLIPPTMLYRFALPCRKATSDWNSKTGIELDENHILPGLGTLDGQHRFADVRTAWTEDGLFVNVDVSHKQQSLWCRETQLIESDGLQVWIDTRNTHNVHRATRYCHWFVFLPNGGGSRKNSAIATMLRINRSKNDPKTLNQVKPKLVAKLKHGGYTLSAYIPRQALDGWDTAEHTRIGFNYSVIDRELGCQTLAVGTEFPVSEDPTLWQTLELVL